MFGIGGFSLWDFIVVGWYHAWDRVRSRFPGAAPGEIVRHEDIRGKTFEVDPLAMSPEARRALGRKP